MGIKIWIEKNVKYSFNFRNVSANMTTFIKAKINKSDSDTYIKQNRIVVFIMKKANIEYMLIG